MEKVVPTLQQDELFYLTVKNFVHKAPSHQQLLWRSYLSLTFSEILNWVENEELPFDGAKRVHVMDFIWNHNCHCKCS